MRLKTIIFYSSFPACASDYMNAWLENNPGVIVSNAQYQQARMGDHSIFVMYTEEGEDKNVAKNEP